MIPRFGEQFRLFFSVAIEPSSAVRKASANPSPTATLAVAVAVLAVLGAATLPRQLSLLAELLAPTGEPMRDMHFAAMHAGLVRAIVLDRIVPPPTVVLATFLLAVVARPVLADSEERGRAVWAVVLLGLAPLVAQRLGELVMTYVAQLDSSPVPGDAVTLPLEFTAGPLLLWRQEGPTPMWLHVINARLNLFTIWAIVIWAVGLRELDGRRLLPWHIGVPAACLLLAGVVTWVVGPLVLGLTLRGVG